MCDSHLNGFVLGLHDLDRAPLDEPKYPTNAIQMDLNPKAVAPTIPLI